jgi:hypothetical protein
MPESFEIRGDIEKLAQSAEKAQQRVEKLTPALKKLVDTMSRANKA